MNREEDREMQDAEDAEVAANARPYAECEVNSDFVVPFLPATEPGLNASANDELLDKYLAHLRTLIDAKTVEALQAGAETAVKVSFLIEFE